MHKVSIGLKEEGMGRLHTLLLQTLAGLHYRRKYCRLCFISDCGRSPELNSLKTALKEKCLSITDIHVKWFVIVLSCLGYLKMPYFYNSVISKGKCWAADSSNTASLFGLIFLLNSICYSEQIIHTRNIFFPLPFQFLSRSNFL